MTKSNSSSRIRRSVRRTIWQRDSEDGCFCCGSFLKEESFHAGHLLPRKWGGSSLATNLVVLCPHCNLAMGAVHVLEYMIMTRQNLDRIRNQPLYPYFKRKHMLIRRARRKLMKNKAGLCAKTMKAMLKILDDRQGRRWEETVTLLLKNKT